VQRRRVHRYYSVGERVGEATFNRREAKICFSSEFSSFFEAEVLIGH
jgi:hypothetical protein